MDLELKRKSVVITGGGSNIGRAIVLGFAAEGANITIGDIDEKQARKVADLALEKGAFDVQVVRTDVTDESHVHKMFEAATAKFGTVHNLVNNVGWSKNNFFVRTSSDEWIRTINLNYLSLLYCVKSALDIMVKQGHGTIVAISSDASRQGEKHEAVYAGTKAAVNAFAKTIAKEHGRDGIRCNVVCPGATIPQDESELGSESLWSRGDVHFSEEQLEKIAKSLPLRKLGRARDIAEAVLFLSSPRAGHITGQVLSVSGGYSMIG